MIQFTIPLVNKASVLKNLHQLNLNQLIEHILKRKSAKPCEAITFSPINKFFQ